MGEILGVPRDILCVGNTTEGCISPVLLCVGETGSYCGTRCSVWDHLFVVFSFSFSKGKK